MTAIYRSYDRAAFEWQYNARLQVAQHAEIVARNEQRSAAFRGRAGARLDVPFGDAPGERLDLFMPRGPGPHPVHLFIHGGYWRSRDKASFSFVAEPLTAAGAIVAITNYDLCPQVSIDTIVDQMRAALSWLWRNASSFGGDPARLHVSGHSAGGHLAAVLAATSWPARDAALPEWLLRTVTSVSGLYQLEPLLLHSVNEDLHMDDADAERLSPVNMTPPAHADVEVFVGADESEEFRWQAAEIARSWSTPARPVTSHEVARHNHFTILESLHDPDFVITRHLIDAMDLG